MLVTYWLRNIICDVFSDIQWHRSVIRSHGTWNQARDVIRTVHWLCMTVHCIFVTLYVQNLSHKQFKKRYFGNLFLDSSTFVIWTHKKFDSWNVYKEGISSQNEAIYLVRFTVSLKSVIQLFSQNLLQCAKHKIGISAGPSLLCSMAYQIFSRRKVGISFNTSNLNF